MRLPSKITSYGESVISKFPPVLLALQGADTGVLALYEATMRYFSIIHFAANKKHIGLYAGEEAGAAFCEELAPYKTSKGTIQIPYQEPLPLELIAKIAIWCYETGNHP